MGMLHSQLAGWFCEAESTYGTDAVDTILDADGAITWQQFDKGGTIEPSSTFYAQNQARFFMDPLAGALIKQGSSVSIPFQFVGKESSAGDPPVYSALLKAAGMTETISVATSATYTPTTRFAGSASVYKYLADLEDTNERLVYTTGVVGGLQISGALDGELMGQFDGLGNRWPQLSNAAAYVDSSDQPILLSDGSTATTSTASWSTKAPMICVGLTVTLGGTSYPISQFSFATNPTLTAKRTITNSGNTDVRIFITGYAPTLSFTLMDGATAYNAALAAFAADTELDTNIEITDGTDTIHFDFPKAQLTANPAMSDNGGLAAWEIQCQTNRSGNTGNDFCSIIYT